MQAIQRIRPDVRLSIRSKLFLTLLAATVSIVAAMYGFMHWSFQHGFVNLMEGRQQARVARAAETLTEVYLTEGSWDRLRGDRAGWRLMLGGGRPMHGYGMGPGPMHGPLPLTLFDADKRYVVGRPDSIERLKLTPIRAGDRIVGYLGYLPDRQITDLIDLRFAEAQRKALVWIALLVGAVSMILAWPLADTLVRPLQRIAAAVRDLAAGRFQTRVQVSTRDELGDLAHDFNVMAHTLEQTETARRQWMADTSHELRTPLALMRAELEAVQDGVRPLDAAAASALLSDVERLTRVVEDLYQLSMTDLGALSYRKRPVDPLALLEDDVEAMSGEFERRQLSIGFRNEVDRSIALQADPDRLSQLFRNLMQNSLRYTEAGGRLEITAAVEQGRMVLDFDDTAPGVPEEALPHLFDRFYRVEASRSRAHGGAGLGLAICRNIVEAHGGLIEARPSTLGGLTIHISLPLAS